MIFTPGSAPILSEEIEEGLAEVEREGDSVIVRLADQGSFTSGSADYGPPFCPFSVGRDRPYKAMAKSA